MENKMLKKISMQEYRQHDALSNHELQIFKNNPSSFIWNKFAPSDPAKVGTSDKGTALHALLLEPETYNDLIIVADVKGRQTQAFQKLQFENPDNIILTEIEAEEVRIMADSATHDPMFKSLLDAEGECETSIFVTEPITGLELKIRPDKVCYIDGRPILTDLKTTSSIDDWRSRQQWKNPLFSFGYGFTAAYYLYVGSIHFGVNLTEYVFPIVQTSASLGKYPVSVFTITKNELIQIGFWQQMLDTLAEFKIRKEQNSFTTTEYFPSFASMYDDGEVEIKFTEE